MSLTAAGAAPTKALGCGCAFAADAKPPTSPTQVRSRTGRAKLDTWVAPWRMLATISVNISRRFISRAPLGSTAREPRINGWPAKADIGPALDRKTGLSATAARRTCKRAHDANRPPLGRRSEYHAACLGER